MKKTYKGLIHHQTDILPFILYLCTVYVCALDNDDDGQVRAARVNATAIYILLLCMHTHTTHPYIFAKNSSIFHRNSFCF